MLVQTRQFHVIVSVEAQDEARPAATMGRFAEYAERLAGSGEDVHVWHLAGAAEPACERFGCLTLHRPGEWRWHDGAGEDDGDGDISMAASPARLASYLLREVLLPHVREDGGAAVMLAEDASTVGAVLHLDWVLRWAELRSRVVMIWNVSHPFGLDEIDWRSICRAAYVTTTNPDMRNRLLRLGVQPVVIPAHHLPLDTLRLVLGSTDADLRDRFEAWR